MNLSCPPILVEIDDLTPMHFKPLHPWIGTVALHGVFAHVPIAGPAFIAPSSILQVIEREEKAPHDTAAINDYGVVRLAAKISARFASLNKAISWQVDRSCFSPVVSRPALYRDSASLAVFRRDKIDARVINPSTLISIFRQPIEDKRFREVASDLGVTRALLHVRA
jgi:hypothetical protein